jgi:2-C-methyl-D-erythritol 2,4-cyclodiphosphate synthase
VAATAVVLPITNLYTSYTKGEGLLPSPFYFKTKFMSYRIGSGVDYHQLTEGRDFWIGGVKIPHHKGALGHSDADVLLHAICDALLGALSLGDIGTHFPDTSPEFKNIDSKLLLAKTFDLISTAGYYIINIDTTLCLQAPKIKPYVEEMRKTIASILQMRPQDVSIKATTTEKMGFVGREEGLVAYATVLLKNIEGD